LQIIETLPDSMILSSLLPQLEQGCGIFLNDIHCRALAWSHGGFR
jgi:hypothetical protein